MRKTIIIVFILTIIATDFTFSSEFNFFQNYKRNVTAPIITDQEIDLVYKEFDIVETSQEPTEDQIIATTIVAHEIVSAHHNNDYSYVNSLLSDIHKSDQVHPSLLRQFFLVQQGLNFFHDKKCLIEQKNLFALQQIAGRNRQNWQKNLWKQEDYRKERKEFAKLTEQFKALEPRIQRSRLFKAEERSRKAIEKQETIEKLLKIYIFALKSSN